jgi:hypothetical protein
VSQTDEEKIAEAKDTVAGCGLILPLLVLGPLTHGYALSVLWGWFVVPFGAPAIGVAHAIGLRLAFGALGALPKSEQKGPNETYVGNAARMWGRAVLAPMLGLLMGEIVRRYM